MEKKPWQSLNVVSRESGLGTNGVFMTYFRLYEAEQKVTNETPLK